jgi:hypothetical protein
MNLSAIITKIKKTARFKEYPKIQSNLKKVFLRRKPFPSMKPIVPSKNLSLEKIRLQPRIRSPDFSHKILSRNCKSHLIRSQLKSVNLR